MATVTTTNVPAPVLRPLVKSPDPSAPFAELLFSGSFVVPLKDAANESQVIISCVMPGLFVYRLTSLEIFIQSSGVDRFDDIEDAWTVVLTENQVTTRRFPLFGLTEFAAAGTRGPAIKIAPDATTDDFGTWFGPIATKIGNQLIDASTGASIMTFQIMDTSSDSTSAFTVVFRFLASAYTITQYEAAPINTPRWDV